MKGLDLSRSYFEEWIQPIIADRVPELGNSYAAALIGWGSDVLGNDDKWSRDHEWGPRCILFLPEHLKDYAETVYTELNTQIPLEFRGYPTRFMADKEDPNIRIPSRDPSAQVHIEISTCEEYLKGNMGVVIPEDDIDWLRISEQRLLGFTRGEVFFDGFGELTRLRNFYDYYPSNVWKYRLAYAWESLGWDVDLIGLCTARGDTLSARYCLGISLYRIMRLVFLLNRRYCPLYPKWLHREFFKLPDLVKEMGPIIEECYCIDKMELVPKKLSEICKVLIEFQNQIDLTSNMEIHPKRFSRGFFDIDCHQIALQIQHTIEGKLSKIELGGAVDQWINNEDFLLNADKMRALSMVYKEED